MKKILLLALFLGTIATFAQTQFKTEHYDSVFMIKNREVLLSLDGRLEIDGHTFDNKKAKDPIKFKVDLKGITIFNSKGEYENRDCEDPKCDIIHLIRKNKYGNNIRITDNPFLIVN